MAPPCQRRQRHDPARRGGPLRRRCAGVERKVSGRSGDSGRGKSVAELGAPGAAAAAGAAPQLQLSYGPGVVTLAEASIR